MHNWITIKSFTYTHEAHLVRTRLEAEGFPIQLKDELTTQVASIYGSSIGGVKLQVPGEFYEEALQVLKEAGYVKEQTRVNNPRWLKLAQRTERIPLIGGLAPEIRLILLVGFLLLLVLVPLSFGMDVQ